MMVSGFDALSRNQSKEQDQDSSAVEEKVLVVDVGVGEWAEELAALGKRRNLLERKLREVVLNFLRFDAMTNGKLPELLSRIVGVLPEKQRSAMTHMTAEDAIGKFLWTDLVKLIGKEWQLFAKILGDNAQFIKHADVINDRFDAHAKPADSADFAMYRRSLKYIEDRIAKLQ